MKLPYYDFTLHTLLCQTCLHLSYGRKSVFMFLWPINHNSASSLSTPLSFMVIQWRTLHFLIQSCLKKIVPALPSLKLGRSHICFILPLNTSSFPMCEFAITFFYITQLSYHQYSVIKYLNIWCRVLFRQLVHLLTFYFVGCVFRALNASVTHMQILQWLRWPSILFSIPSGRAERRKTRP